MEYHEIQLQPTLSETWVGLKMGFSAIFCGNLFVPGKMGFSAIKFRAM